MAIIFSKVYSWEHYAQSVTGVAGCRRERSCTTMYKKMLVSFVSAFLWVFTNIFIWKSLESYKRVKKKYNKHSYTFFNEYHIPNIHFVTSIFSVSLFSIYNIHSYIYTPIQIYTNTLFLLYHLKVSCISQDIRHLNSSAGIF